MMKFKQLALIASIALPLGLGAAPAFAQQATCPQYTAAGTAIRAQYLGLVKDAIKPDAAATTVVVTLRSLNPNPADTAAIDGTVAKLAAAKYPKDGVKQAIEGLEPTFRARAQSAGCTLPPLPKS